MGRRALRKIDPHLDLSRHFRSRCELPEPWDDRALFGRTAPLEIDVGCGKGLFIEQASLALPAHNFLGIEVSRKYARYSASRLAKRKANNALIVAGDAQQLFAELLPPDTVAAVHIYFPDPWWKKRHHRRRIMNDLFLTEVYRVLAPQGALHFWTDVAAYYEESVPRVLAASLEGPFSEPEQQPEHDLDFRTHFERRKRIAGLPIYRARFLKPAASPATAASRRKDAAATGDSPRPDPGLSAAEPS